ncbi:MAG: hypothetical protein SNJ71_01745 [Bacteroidales bacterium]
MSGTFEYINTDYLEEVSEGNNNLIYELIDLFIKQSSEFISNFQTSLQENDLLLSKKTAHKAINALTIIGHKHIIKDLEIIENNETISFQSLEDIYNKFIDINKQILKELEDYKKKIDNQ